MYNIELKNNLPSNLFYSRLFQIFDYNYHRENTKVNFDRLFNKSVLEAVFLIDTVRDQNNNKVSLYDFYLYLKKELRIEFYITYGLWEEIRKNCKIIPSNKAYNLFLLFLQNKLLNIHYNNINDFTYFSLYTKNKEVYNGYPLKISYDNLLNKTFPIYNNTDIFNFLITNCINDIEFVKVSNVYKCNDFEQYKIGYVMPEQLKRIKL